MVFRGGNGGVLLQFLLYSLPSSLSSQQCDEVHTKLVAQLTKS